MQPPLAIHGTLQACRPKLNARDLPPHSSLQSALLREKVLSFVHAVATAAALLMFNTAIPLLSLIAVMEALESAHAIEVTLAKAPIQARTGQLTAFLVRLISLMGRQSLSQSSRGQTPLLPQTAMLMKHNVLEAPAILQETIILLVVFVVHLKAHPALAAESEGAAALLAALLLTVA